MRHLPLLLSALLFSALAHATSTANITTISCSGSQSFDLTNSAALSCDGDFSLIGGSINSDQGITISAFGSLFIDDLTLSAPAIQLKTLSGVLTLGGGVSITTGLINVDVGNNISPRITLSPDASLNLRGWENGIRNTSGGEITVSPGGDLSLVPSVPEPDKFWSMLAGGILLLAISHVRRKH